MKKNLFLIGVLLLTMCSSLFAQVTIVVNEPVVQSLTLNNVFNFTLMQANVSSYSVQWLGMIYKNNQLVASGSSQQISVSESMAQFNNSSGSFAYNTIGLTGQSLNGDLPFGNYRFCVKALIYVNGVKEQEIEDCLDKEYTPMSPPFLVSPENGEELSIPNPLLVWSPPMPILNDASLVYRLRLVEVLFNQTPINAIQSNLALLDVDNLTQTNYLYPINAPILIPGKRYAWRVSTKTVNYNFGNTETWSFVYTQPEPDTTLTGKEPHIVMARAGTAEFKTKDGFLYIQLDEHYNETNLLYKVYNQANQEVDVSCSEVPSKKQGDNRLNFDFKQCSSLPKGRYKMEVYGNANTIQSVYFVYE